MKCAIIVEVTGPFVGCKRKELWTNARTYGQSPGQQFLIQLNVRRQFIELSTDKFTQEIEKKSNKIENSRQVRQSLLGNWENIKPNENRCK